MTFKKRILAIIGALFIIPAVFCSYPHAFALSPLEADEIRFLRSIEPDWVDAPKYMEMLDDLEDNERLPVIIGFDPQNEYGIFVSEGDLQDSGEITGQREGIARVQDELIQRLSTNRIKNEKKFETIPYLAMDVDVFAFSRLVFFPEVASIFIDEENELLLSDSIPLIGADNAWSDGYTGAGRGVAILDTGVDKTHPFLQDKVVSEACYSTHNPSGGILGLCPDHDPSVIGSGAAAPCSGYTGCDHGTHVAGIAAGSGSSFSGVAKDSDIIAIKIFHYNSSAGQISYYNSDLLHGLERVYALRDEYNIAAVNLSVGGEAYSSSCDAAYPYFKEIADNLRSAGIAVVAASGNNGYINGIDQPACVSSIISVGATDKADNDASFSNVSADLDLLAPGVDIESSVPGPDYKTKSGTSMAAPHVTGAFALIKSKAQDASVNDILSALKSTGEPIHIVWNDYSYTKPRIQVDAAADTFTIHDPANMLSPDPGSQLSSTTVTFTWEDVGADQYALWIGSSEGGADIGSEYTTGASATVSGLPTDRRTLYVTLRSKFGSAWESNSYEYTALAFSNMISPAPGSQLNSATVAFTWEDVHADLYALWIGSYLGGNDIYSKWLDDTSVTVSGLPGDGSAVYVRLWTYSDYLKNRLYEYTAVGSASMLSPVPGSQLSSTTVTFTWEDVGADQYALWIGSSEGGSDIWSENTTGTSTTVSGLPTDRRTLFVTLRSKFGVTWESRSYEYTALAISTMLSPVPRSQFDSSTVTFLWEDVHADLYAIWIGTYLGGNDIYSKWLEDTTVTVSGLPSDGSTVYVRLWTYSDYIKDRIYEYTAAAVEPAKMLSPAPGSQLSSTTATFTWEDVGADQYALWIGSSEGGSDIWSENTAGASATVSGLPTDRRTLYVTLRTKFGDTWQSRSYEYTALAISTMLSPVPGSQFDSSTVTFTWEDVHADLYAIWIGTYLGGNDIYSKWLGDTTVTVSGLPSDGSTVYVRLWTYSDYIKDRIYEYTALGAATMLSPAPGSQLSSNTVAFTWEDVGADQYALWIGSSEGGSDIRSEDTNGTSVTVSGLPTDRSTLYATLRTKFGSTWESRSYEYTALAVSTMLSPVPGSQFGSTTVTFTWEDVHADLYAIWIGTYLGGDDIYSEWLEDTTVTVSGLPNDGSTVHVRLWTYSDYVKNRLYQYIATH